jgi:surfeit locus 1 family protein
MFKAGQSLGRASLKSRMGRVMFSSTATPAQSSKDTLGIAIFGAICLSTCGLGVWQLQRYTWKVDLLEQTKKAFELDSEAVPQRAFGQAELFAYLQEKYGQRIAIKGEFDHDNEVKIGPRAAPPGLITDAAQGMATNPQGYFIITPFKLSHGCTVFVNRGWVKRGAQDTIDRPKGIITLENIIVSSTEKPNKFNPLIDKKAIDSKTLIWMESNALVEAGGAQRIIQVEEGVPVVEVVDPDSAPTPKSYPVPRRFKHVMEPSVTPLTHLTYAFTWFSLAAAGTAMTYYKFKGKGRSPKTRVKVSKQA